MNIRLVAYRKQLPTSTEEFAYELDLQEAPNVSLNFQFSDIKNPETRKASYSQTFKLPFTKNNNTFFQNWFNVNLQTLVFSTRKKFTAILYVGTVPQFEGYLRLQSVYKKNNYYEVVLISNTADLFTVIGEQKLKDVFKNDETGVYSEELNHTFNNLALSNSWNGSTTSFQNTAGNPLRDAVSNVQKVMYPLSITRDKFFYTAGSNQYLDMSTNLDADYMVNINQFRPAIQIKYLFNKIINKAGLTYTSTFIDGDYFGNLFMTTGNTLEEPVLPTGETMTAVDGGSLDARLEDYSNNGFGYLNPGFCFSLQTGAVQQFMADNCSNCTDVADVWDDTNYVFHKISPTMEEVTIRGRLRKRAIKACGGATNDQILVTVKCNKWDGTQDTDEILYEGYITTLTGTSSTGTQTYSNWSHVIPLNNVDVGEKFRISLHVAEVETTQFGEEAWFQMQRGVVSVDGASYFSRISCTWVPYTPSQYGGVIDVPACIDPDITQRQFLKDIIERFNLVLLVDPNNASNLIIEPYDTYLTGGEIKEWTHKLDLSKEIIVKDTTSLQKRIINFTDKEDVDLMNKSIKENIPALNVYGKYYNDKTSNDFASGELKNTSLFSPFINQQVFKNQDDQQGTDLPSMAVQYEVSYKEVDFGGGVAYEPDLKATKPKIFYYSGTMTEINNAEGSQTDIYLHHINPTTAVVTAYSYNVYPLCSPWDIDNDDGEYTLSTTNKSLYWDFAPPVAPELSVFNFSQNSDTWEGNSLYYLYWKSYLDSIYGSESRIMECYLNLNGIDIFNFKFNDEIFIKDSYWRVLNIDNYQVGDNVSTKVTLLKITDTLEYAEDVDYIAVGMLGGVLITFCPTDTPGCTPALSPPTFTGLLADEASCFAAGGTPFTNWTNGNGLFPCLANSGSLPANFKSQNSAMAVVGYGQLKTFISGKLGGRNTPLIKGVNTSKYVQKILPYYGDDIVIKYKSRGSEGPLLDGESHKLILTGYQEGTTMGYAYPEGKSGSEKIIIPPNSNMIINIDGISTVVGGSSTLYPVGDTEAFGYNTVFVSRGGVVSQVGTVGGILKYAIKAASATSALYITQTNNELQFGIVGNQADTNKSFTLTANILIQRISSIQFPHKANWALFQNYDNIVLQNGNYLIWN